MGAAVTSIREWQHLPIGPKDLPIDIADRLHALAEKETRRLRMSQPILTRTAKPSLRAGQAVGVLSVPGASVEILPKIGGEGDGGVRLALTRMLAVAWGLPIADSEPALLATQREVLLEVLIRLFADRLLVAVRRGLPHRYRRQEDDLPLLRGKLSIPRQLARYATRADRLACSFDELSVDTTLNRVLKAAVKRLSATTRSAANSRRLAELMARFEFVGDSTNPIAEPAGLDRTNTAFHRLHRMARLLLGGDWQGTTTGAAEGHALLFPMNDLFEVFVGLTLKAAVSPQPVLLQATGRYALEGPRHGLFALRPDIVVNGNLIIDTKWKELKPAEPAMGVEQADVYQMLAYGRAYDATRLVLLYPWHEGLNRPGVLRRWHVPGNSTTFDIAAVDVGKPNSVRSTLQRIVAGGAIAGHL